MNPSLRRIAESQAGAFTREQARRCGMTDHAISTRILDRDWIPVMADVLICAGAPVTAAMKAWTGVLAIGHPVAVAGGMAASWLELERAPRSWTPEFVVPGDRRFGRLPGLLVRRVEPADWRTVWHRQLPVTPVAVTIRDLAARLPSGEVRDIAQHALRRRRVTMAELQRCLGRGRSGSAAMRRILEELAPGFHVTWERLLHRALAEAGVVMTPQVPVRAPDGRVAYLDLGRVELRFGVEIDGFINHMARFAADRRRARMLALELDWVIANVAVEELEDDLAGVVAEIVAYVRRLERLLAAG
jgi:hypothetical protein